MQLSDSLVLKNHLNSWLVVTFREPCLFDRSDHEVWMMNPGVRYVLNAFQLRRLEQYVESSSELRGSANYRPLNARANLAESRVVIQRVLDRGIGDLAFMTGPMAYMHAITAGTVKLDMYALADRSQVMLHNPLLRHRTTLAGPQSYDSMVNYDFHWMVDVATEYDQERDQLNVYDCLFQQLGVDYTKVDQKFKRPSLALNEDDRLNFDTFAMHIFRERGYDLRKTPYYVVAPLANGSLRTAPYAQWGALISKLQETRPVIVMGTVHERMPQSDMSVGEFISWVDQLGSNVINMVSAKSPLRVAMSVIANAVLAVTLDSGMLYVAQAFRTPAVSVWGTHHPGTRLHYDKEYMDLAVWKPELCRHAPCYAYSGFPYHKCPRREDQSICEVLNNESFVDDVMAKIESVEGRRVSSVPIFNVPKK